MDVLHSETRLLLILVKRQHCTPCLPTRSPNYPRHILLQTTLVVEFTDWNWENSSVMQFSFLISFFVSLMRPSSIGTHCFIEMVFSAAIHKSCIVCPYPGAYYKGAKSSACYLDQFSIRAVKTTLVALCSLRTPVPSRKMLELLSK